MPHVAVLPASGEVRLAAASRRWDALVRARPDLTAPVALQRRLLTRIIGLADAVEHGRLPRLALPARYLTAKLARGVPALSGEPVPLPVEVLVPALHGLCGDLEEGGAGEAAAHVRARINETRLDPGSLLAASLGRNQHAIRAAAVQHGLSADLLWLVAELAVSPYAHALQRMLFGRLHTEPALGAGLDAWSSGYCPACGSWPALAEVAAGHRVLRCSFCAFAWELKVYACVYCGEAGGKFVAGAPDADRVDRRVEACGTCGSYLKTVDVPELSPFPLLALADLETTDLDRAAMERGYSRPPLKEIGRRR